LADIASAAGKRAALGLRVNPLKHVKGRLHAHGGRVTAVRHRREQLPEAIRLAKKSAWLHVVGIHVYGGTQIFRCWRTAGALRASRRDRQRLWRPNLDSRSSFIDFGGGFGVPYFEDLPELDLDAFAEGYRGVVSVMSENTRCWSVFGPSLSSGRYLVAEAGIYATRVVDIKHSRGKTFVVTDGGMNHHITATGNLPGVAQGRTRSQ